MVLNQPADQKQQSCHIYLFSIIFPSLWLHSQEQRAHNGPTPASRPQTTKILQLLFLYYHFFSMVATKEQRAHNGPKPASRTKNNKDVTIPYSLLSFYIYGYNYKSRENTMALNQPGDQKPQRCHNYFFSITFLQSASGPHLQRRHATTPYSPLPIFLYGCNHKSREYNAVALNQP
jgi:hypothetical protein